MFRFDGHHHRSEKLKSRNPSRFSSMLPTYELTEEFIPFFHINLRNTLLAGCSTAEYSNTFNTVAKQRDILNDA